MRKPHSNGEKEASEGEGRDCSYIEMHCGIVVRKGTYMMVAHVLTVDGRSVLLSR